MTASDRFFITSLFVKDKSDSKSTVPTSCYLPDFFILPDRFYTSKSGMTKAGILAGAHPS